VKAKILAIDIEKERISLGVKQLSDAPEGALKADDASAAVDGLSKGATVTCIVSEVHDDGITVKVSENVTSFIKKADLARERQDQRVERFAVGGKVSVSIKALETDDHKKAISEYGSDTSGASLGDILGAALSAASEGKKSKK
jgi:small subunit ribosomal protein S1